MVTVAGEKKKQHKQVIVPHIDAAVSVSDMVSASPLRKLSAKASLITVYSLTFNQLLMNKSVLLQGTNFKFLIDSYNM